MGHLVEPLDIPEYLKVFFLVKQQGMFFTPTGITSANYLGTGFFLSRTDAEHQRTMEYLKITEDQENTFIHIYELDVPNPAYKT